MKTKNLNFTALAAIVALLAVPGLSTAAANPSSCTLTAPAACGSPQNIDGLTNAYSCPVGTVLVSPSLDCQFSYSGYGYRPEDGVVQLGQNMGINYRCTPDYNTQNDYVHWVFDYQDNRIMTATCTATPTGASFKLKSQEK